MRSNNPISPIQAVLLTSKPPGGSVLITFFRSKYGESQQIKVIVMARRGKQVNSPLFKINLYQLYQ